MSKADPYLFQVQIDHVLDLSRQIAGLIRGDLPDLEGNSDQRAMAATALAVAAQMLDRLDDGKPMARLNGVTGALGSMGVAWIAACAKKR